MARTCTHHPHQKHCSFILAAMNLQHEGSMPALRHMKEFGMAANRAALNWGWHVGALC